MMESNIQKWLVALFGDGTAPPPPWTGNLPVCWPLSFVGFPCMWRVSRAFLCCFRKGYLVLLVTFCVGVQDCPSSIVSYSYHTDTNKCREEAGKGQKERQAAAKVSTNGCGDGKHIFAAAGAAAAAAATAWIGLVWWVGALSPLSSAVRRCARWLLNVTFYCRLAKMLLGWVYHACSVLGASRGGRHR